ncbi:hypothetical protein Tco_0689458 [Tanacetum coccineum]
MLPSIQASSSTRNSASPDTKAKEIDNHTPHLKSVSGRQDPEQARRDKDMQKKLGTPLQGMHGSQSVVKASLAQGEEMIANKLNMVFHFTEQAIAKDDG